MGCVPTPGPACLRRLRLSVRPSPFGWLHMWFGWFYLLSLRAALLPLLPGGPARHCVPRPSAAWHSLPDTMQQPPLHACASELRAAAGQGPRGPGLQRPSPPAEGIPWPFGHAHIHRVGWVGKKFGWLALDGDRGRCASGRSRASLESVSPASRDRRSHSEAPSNQADKGILFPTYLSATFFDTQ